MEKIVGAMAREKGRGCNFMGQEAEKDSDEKTGETIVIKINFDKIILN